MQDQTNIDDLKPFTHGQEGTHWACNWRIENEGGKALCCSCKPHEECDAKAQNQTNQSWRHNLHNTIKEIMGLTNLPGIIVDSLDAAYLEGLQQNLDSKRSLYIQRIEEMKKEVPAIDLENNGNYDDSYYEGHDRGRIIGFNQALDQAISIIKQGDL